MAGSLPIHGAPPPPDVSPSDRIRGAARALGFDAVGIARIEPLEAVARYQEWLDRGRHGEMSYLASERHRQRRASPERVLAGVRSVVCVALCHEPQPAPERDRRLGRIARYARGEDYHRVMRDSLGALEREVLALLPGAAALGYADTGAVLERAWAERAGLGWIAKNTCMIGERLGSYFVLGELLVDRELVPDAPKSRHRCGTCRRCIDACPTGAIVAPQQLDARRCISYLTIELRGPIPRELRPLVGDWIFGCDICQDVCPWNRFAPPAREARLHARELDGWTLERFLELDEPGFQALFAASPVRRAKRAGFLRNVCVALGNRGEAASMPALVRALEHDPDALVRGHAAWALARVAARLDEPDPRRAQAREAIARRAREDEDAFVREECLAER